MKRLFANLNSRAIHTAAARGLNRQKYNLVPGQTIHGFTLEESKYIPIYDMTGYKLVHNQTKARYIHLDSANTDNSFAVLFRTPPINSTGICHILEHLSLCGSKKYPVRDPFFNMIRRSLNTYMNAWTGADFTMYPFSSQNKKDFQNLMSVYLDATFFPLLRHEDFLQEGHRLEFTPGEGKLQVNGVVYNEMKGAMSNPEEYFSLRLMQNLFRTNCYRFNSGGDPAIIPELQLEQLRDFHSTYYHPSNAWFYSFGDLDFTEHLSLINSQVLSQFPAAKSVDSKIAKEPRSTGATRTVEERFVPDKMRPLNQQGKLAMACLCDESYADPYKSAAMMLISKLLVDGTSSPMYKALVASGLADSYCPGMGYDLGTRDAVFTLGVQGSLYDAEHLSRVEKAITDTLRQVREKGFDEKSFEKALHETLFSAVLLAFDPLVATNQGKLWPEPHLADDPPHSLRLRPLPCLQCHRICEPAARGLQAHHAFPGPRPAVPPRQLRKSVLPPASHRTVGSSSS